jgi:hypothetical protein
MNEINHNGGVLEIIHTPDEIKKIKRPYKLEQEVNVIKLKIKELETTIKKLYIIIEELNNKIKGKVFFL